jgi:hypothetical protein
MKKLNLIVIMLMLSFSLFSQKAEFMYFKAKLSCCQLEVAMLWKQKLRK